MTLIKIDPPLQKSYLFEGKVWMEGQDEIPGELGIKLGLCQPSDVVTLPKDIPHRKILIESGYGNWSYLKQHKNISGIDGMGPVRAKPVREYIELHMDDEL